MRRPQGHGRIDRIVVLGPRRVGIDVGCRFGTVQHGWRVHVTPARRLARVDWRGDRTQAACPRIVADTRGVIRRKLNHQRHDAPFGGELHRERERIARYASCDQRPAAARSPAPRRLRGSTSGERPTCLLLRPAQ
jgi:hypothetical protein